MQMPERCFCGVLYGLFVVNSAPDLNGVLKKCILKTALFFGSFNPVHNGHLMIANYILEFSDLENLWFVISPQNPLKERKSLLADYHRYALLNEAIGVSNKYKVSNIEFYLPKPSYTIDTLVYLKEKYPKRKFALILGGDNLRHFHKWKNYEIILQDYTLYVYPRPGEELPALAKHENVQVVNAPLMEISSSFIRKSIKAGKDVQFFMPERAYEYMREMHFYEK